MSDLPESNLKHDWIPLESEADGKYLYPAAVRNYLPGKKDAPGVYRWSFYRPEDPPGKPCQVLIGQTESLLRRLTEYSKPTTKEERARQLYFLSQVEQALKIDCHLLQFENISIK